MNYLHKELETEPPHLQSSDAVNEEQLRLAELMASQQCWPQHRLSEMSQCLMETGINTDLGLPLLYPALQACIKV